MQKVHTLCSLVSHLSFQYVGDNSDQFIVEQLRMKVLSGRVITFQDDLRRREIRVT